MAANATDLRIYYSQVLGPTLLLAVGALGVQTSDQDGPLTEGRYLVRALTLTGICWVKAVPFVAGGTPSVITPNVAGMAAGSELYGDEFPLDTVSGVRSFVLHVRGQRNDRLQARCSGGAAVLAITRVGE
jgi:hypothetical protein